MPELTGGGQGPFALIQPFMGQSANDKIRHFLDQQAAANAGAVAGDPNAPFSGAYAAPPTGGPPKPPPMGAAAPGPGEPAAMKTPESWGSMLMDLQQQNEAEAGFNKSIGLGLSAFAPPRSKEALVHAFDPSQPKPDPFRMGESLMNMSSMQQGQDRANQIARLVNDPKTGQAIADRLHMDYGALKTGITTDPGMVAKIAQALGTPTPEMATLEQLQHMPGGPSGSMSGRQLGDLKILAAAGVAPEFAQQMVADQETYRRMHNGEDPPWVNNKAAYDRYKTDLQERETSAAKFGEVHGNTIDKVTEFQHRVESLKTDPGMVQIMNNPNVYRQAMKWIMQHKNDTPEQIAAAAPDWAATIVGYTPEVKKALTELQLLRSRDYANAMHSIGQRFSTQEVENVSKGMDSLLSLELSPKDYQEGLDNLVDETKTIRANSHGAAQEFDTMDPDLRTYVNPTFTKGGRRNVEGTGSEDWADKVKPPPEEIAAAKKALENNVPRRVVERRMREHGFRPMGF